MQKLKRIETLLLFLTILFLPTQLGRHFWPEFSFVYSLPIDYLSPTLYFWDILVIGLWIVFIIRGQHINRLAMNLYYFFILTQSLSLIPLSFNNLNVGAGLVRLEQYTIVGLFGVYIASLKLTSQNSKLFLPLSLAVIGESILAIGQFFKEGTIGLWILGERSFSLSTPGIAKFDFYGRDFLRPYATFPHPNVLAGFLVISLVILSVTKDLNYILRPRLKLGFRMTLIRVVGFLAGISVLLTVSRVAIVTGLTSSMILVKGKGRMLLILAVIILLPILFTRFSSLLNFDNLTFTRREELSKVALTLWVGSPILGIGLNNFIPQAADLLLTGPSRFLQPVHNIFLLTLSETGIIGLLGLVSLIGFPILLSLRKFFDPEVLRVEGQGSIFYRFRITFALLGAGKSGLTVAWIAVIFLGMFDHYFLTLPQGYRLLFFVWGLSFSTMSLLDEKREG